jgi:hypothetical protein
MAARIADRKHEPVSETVVVPFERTAVRALPLDDEPAIGQHLAVRVFRAEALEYFVPGIGRETDEELVDGFAREPALFHVLLGARVVRQHAREILGHAQVHVVQRRRAARGVGLAAGVARDVEAEPTS